MLTFDIITGHFKFWKSSVLILFSKLNQINLKSNIFSSQNQYYICFPVHKFCSRDCLENQWSNMSFVSAPTQASQLAISTVYMGQIPQTIAPCVDGLNASSRNFDTKGEAHGRPNMTELTAGFDVILLMQQFTYQTLP